MWIGGLPEGLSVQDLELMLYRVLKHSDLAICVTEILEVSDIEDDFHEMDCD
jgi:hypothetical protein